MLKSLQFYYIVYVLIHEWGGQGKVGTIQEESRKSRLYLDLLVSVTVNYSRLESYSRILLYRGLSI